MGGYNPTPLVVTLLILVFFYCADGAEIKDNTTTLIAGLYVLSYLCSS